MQTANDFDRSVQALLDLIGGEPLAGSSFEIEEPQPEYGSEQVSTTSTEPMLIAGTQRYPLLGS